MQNKIKWIFFGAQNKLVDIAILFEYKVSIKSATFELDREKGFRQVWPGLNICYS